MNIYLSWHTNNKSFHLFFLDSIFASQVPSDKIAFFFLICSTFMWAPHDKNMIRLCSASRLAYSTMCSAMTFSNSYVQSVLHAERSSGWFALSFDNAKHAGHQTTEWHVIRHGHLWWRFYGTVAAFVHIRQPQYPIGALAQHHWLGWATHENVRCLFAGSHLCHREASSD